MRILSERYRRSSEIIAMGISRGITPENEKVMKKVAIRYA
jgi:hypothetical protein